MGVLETMLDKVMFWRRDPEDFDVDGCFTLPDADLDCEAPAPDEPSGDLGQHL